MSPAENYQKTADTLVERIKALVPAHPEVLTMNSAWDLFKISDFKCDDIGPSYAQAAWALRKAQKEYADAFLKP
jgi:hypothetical protein